MGKTLIEMLSELRTLLDEKDFLEAFIRENQSKIEAKKQEIIQQMIDDNTARVTAGDYVYSLKVRTKYSKIGDKTLAASGIDFRDTLRREGFGFLIQESVSERDLQKAMTAFCDEHGELSEGLLKIIRPFEFCDIACTKKRKGRMKDGI